MMATALPSGGGGLASWSWISAGRLSKLGRDHWPGRRRSGARGRHERAARHLERPAGRGEGGEALLQRSPDLLDLRLRAREHRVMEVAREVQRRLPQLLEALVDAAQLQGLAAHVGEARPVEELREALGAP